MQHQCPSTRSAMSQTPFRQYKTEPARLPINQSPSTAVIPFAGLEQRKMSHCSAGFDPLRIAPLPDVALLNFTFLEALIAAFVQILLYSTHAVAIENDSLKICFEGWFQWPPFDFSKMYNFDEK